MAGIISESRVPSRWRLLLTLLLGAFLGGRFRRALYRRLCGYEIATDASIGLALISVAHAKIGPGCHVGHFTVIRNLDSLVLTSEARIGTFNWVFGMLPSKQHFIDEPDRRSVLVMEEGSALTSRHIVDCTAAVTIGRYATIAGFNSQILTHGIDVETNRQTSRQVIIGEYAMVGSRVIVLKGARVPERAVVGAGSVFSGSPDGTGGLWSGVPAARVREIDENGAYFGRTSARVK